MKAGIVGLPNVGKSTLFNCLSNAKAQSANFPFCTIEPNVGVVNVPDERIAKLESMVNPERVMPATVEIVDIAGLVKGASKGEGLGNKFLANIREVDMIAHVVRIFDNENIVHVHGEVKPVSDIEVINLELVLADQQTVAKRLGSIDKEVRSQKKGAKEEKEVLEQLSTLLEAGKMVHSKEWTDDQKLIIKNLHLLTAKTMLYVLNRQADGQNLDELADDRYKQCVAYIKDLGSDYVELDASVESEIAQVAEDDKEELRRELLALPPQEVAAVARPGLHLRVNRTADFSRPVREGRFFMRGFLPCGI